jgi:hypothetical protein
MGKTVMPFSEALAAHEGRLRKYRRALRADDQRAFDALFESARLHIQAGVQASCPDPAEAVFVSILIENWKRIDDLELRVRQLELEREEDRRAGAADRGAC